ncbi:MAG: response regulator [Anaerolineales bacterium]|nr:response regulator [Anaerolineales bacterium]
MSQVLVVEDRESILTSLKMLLELEGYKVFTATTKKGIEETLEAHPIDLVLLDVYFQNDQSENTNGYDILEMIHRTPMWRGTRVLMTSGEDFREQALQAGADGFLLKPYDPDTLVNLIRSKLLETG